eukprot:364364-Chlamydomonas_euryale.AAC.4
MKDRGVMMMKCDPHFGAHECRDKLTVADVKAALEDMSSIMARLRTHTSQKESWTAPDVGIACYLFFFMIEVAWTLLFHAAEGQRPEPLSKQSATPCSFSVPVRHTREMKYVLPRPLKQLDKKPRSMLEDLLTKWSPHNEKNSTNIVYNKVAYWLHALRLIRDVGTHRSLALVQRPTPGTEETLRVKLPRSPAAKETKTNDSRRDLPTFSTDPHAFSDGIVNDGYCFASVEEIADTIHSVAEIVHTSLAAVVIECGPSLDDALAHETSERSAEPGRCDTVCEKM